MLEVNAIYFILLVEGFVLLLILLLAWLLVALVRMRRRNKVVADLALQIRQRKDQRDEQTRAFLQLSYQLEGEDLNTALMDIGKHESEFFQCLLECMQQANRAKIGALESALKMLVESYKCLQPRIEGDLERVEIEVEELTSLRGENDELRSELSVANNRLSNMIAEFGEIFGGGKDHQLTLQEIMDKVDAMKPDQVERTPRQVQK